jgi:YbbR domain-containing protein
MKRLLANWGLKGLAVLAAIIFWVLVIGTENKFYTFPEAVQIKPFNISDDLVVSGALGSVKLTLKTNNKDTQNSLVTNDFDAYVDLDGLKEGELEVPVIVSSKKSDVSVLKVEPSNIKVKIEKRSEKEVPVDYIVKGVPKEGFVVREVLINQEKVIIKGSQDVLNNVNTATVVIELTGEDKDTKKVFPIKALDKDGNEISGVVSDIKEAEADIKISAITNQKIVGVKPDIKGSPSENFWIKSINVSPSYVVLNGSTEALESVEFISTKEIDVQNLTENGTYYVQVVGLPDGVSVEGSTEISVTIEVASYNSSNSTVKRKTVNVPVVVSKFLKPQSNFTIDPRSVTLVAEGSDEDLEKISALLKIELDITDAEENQKEFIIDKSFLDLPQGIAVVSINPAKVTVKW